MANEMNNRGPYPPWQIYLHEDPPTSGSGELLSMILFVQVCLSDGWGPEQIAAAFARNDDDAMATRVSIRNAIKLFAGPLQNGRFQTYARPIGGGKSVSIPADHWELDDPLPRYAASAYAYSDPFNLDAKPTHWIFVDPQVEEQIRQLHMPIADGPGIKRRSKPSVLDDQTSSEETYQPGNSMQGRVAAKSFLRRDQVENLVGLKKTEIYDRMADGRFPKNHPMGAGRARGWKLAEIEDWLDNPT